MKSDSVDVIGPDYVSDILFKYCLTKSEYNASIIQLRQDLSDSAICLKLDNYQVRNNFIFILQLV